jgi:histidinol phosphate phosphatase hisN-like protein
MLVSEDASVLFGLGKLMPTSLEEIFGALNRLAVWDFENPNGSGGRSWVSPDEVAAHAVRAADRLAVACDRGESVFFGTGHPTGPLEMYVRLADAMRARGAKIMRVAEGEAFEGYVGGAQLRYVCDVACVSMGGDLVHTHSARPMEFLLTNGLAADLVVGDHGFAGAALARGIDAIAVIDTNDPALVLAWSRGLPVVPILCDDNRPPGSYEALTRFIVDRLG